MKPAARITDMHTCPMVNGHGPARGRADHTAVRADGPHRRSAAARVTDHAICTGPIDTIVLGSLTVLIGGQQAARIGDLTVHGGVIVTGCPTVLIGDVGMGGAGSAQGSTMAAARAVGAPFCEICEQGG